MKNLKIEWYGYRLALLRDKPGWMGLKLDRSTGIVHRISRHMRGLRQQGIGNSTNSDRSRI